MKPQDAHTVEIHTSWYLVFPHCQRCARAICHGNWVQQQLVFGPSFEIYRIAVSNGANRQHVRI